MPFARALGMTPVQIKRAQSMVGPYQKMWDKYAPAILSIMRGMFLAGDLKQDIPVYLIAGRGSFSDPLCIDSRYTPRDAVDVATHELLHRSLYGYKLPLLFKDFKNESPITQIHILVHALHAFLYMELGWYKRLQNDITYCQKYPDYKRAWKIVEDIGYAQIINRYFH